MSALKDMIGPNMTANQNWLFLITWLQGPSKVATKIGLAMFVTLWVLRRKIRETTWNFKSYFWLISPNWPNLTGVPLHINTKDAQSCLNICWRFTLELSRIRKYLLINNFKLEIWHLQICLTKPHPRKGDLDYPDPWR